jgi:hypothetical protein
MLSTERTTAKVKELPATTLEAGWTVGVARVVMAGVTVKFTTELVLARKLASPGKAAVRALAPPGSRAVCNSAIPSLAIAAVPKDVLPLLKVMVPVAAPLGTEAEALWP